MGMMDFLKVSNGIANSIHFVSPILGEGTYSGHVDSSRKPNGHGVFVNSLDIEYEGEWSKGKLCGFGKKYATGYYDMVQSSGDEEAGKSLVYAGNFLNDRFHGQGKEYSQTGKIIYDGEWLEGWKCGEGTEYYENGREKFKGTWQRSRYHGKGVFTCKNGSIINGEWINGRLEGEATLTDRDNCVYKRIYKEGDMISETLISGTPKPSPDSKRTLRFDTGIYEGEVSFTGKMHGKGVFTYNNGNKYEGSFKEGVKHGSGVFTWANGDLYKGEFENDLRCGYGVYTSQNGNKYDGEWKDNLKNGHGIFYYSNGDRFDGYFLNSLKHGHGIFYSKNGDSFEGEWKNDMRCGNGIVTLADGKKIRQTWENEKLISEEMM